MQDLAPTVGCRRGPRWHRAEATGCRRADFRTGLSPDASHVDLAPTSCRLPRSLLGVRSFALDLAPTSRRHSDRPLSRLKPCRRRADVAPTSAFVTKLSSQRPRADSAPPFALANEFCSRPLAEVAPTSAPTPVSELARTSRRLALVTSESTLAYLCCSLCCVLSSAGCWLFGCVFRVFSGTPSWGRTSWPM